MKEEEALLWHRWVYGRDARARDALILRFQYLVSITAQRVTYPAGIEREDMIGAGLLALVRAVDQFEPGRGVKFLTYAITLIRGAMLEYLRSNDTCPRLERDREKMRQTARQVFASREGREPTLAELAQELGIAESLLEKQMRAWGLSQAPASLDTLMELRVVGDNSDKLTALDLVRDEEAGPEAQAIEAEASNSLRRAVQQLPEREAEVVRRYYGNEQTFREIGLALQISESRAYQLHAQALRRLRGRMDLIG